jgi:group I intron endonuclease
MDTLALDTNLWNCASLPRRSGIYAIRTPSGREYIGSAVNLLERWRTHGARLRKGDHHCRGLQNAARKYGIRALVFRILAFVPRTELLDFEQAFFDSRGIKNLLNHCPFARNALGVKHDAAFRARISARLKGKKLSPEHVRKLREAIRPPHTAAQKAKNSVAHKGKSKPLRSRLNFSKTRNTSGFPFVVHDRKRGNWIARPAHAGKYKNLGRFPTAEAANAAVMAFTGGDVWTR